MKRLRYLSWLVVLLLVFVIHGATAPTSAQSPNLLANPAFEGPHYNAGRSDLNMPNGWLLWVADSPRGQEWQNRGDHLFIFPHCTAPQVLSGPCSLNLNGGFVTFTAAVYQTVVVPPRSNVQASVNAWVQTCNSRDQFNVFNGYGCGSSVASEVFVRVGIDPNGGTNPADPAIVWGPAIAPHDRWEIASANATANAGAVTMFVYTAQTWPSDFNNRFYDNASLTIGGPGGASPIVAGSTTNAPAAAPTPRPTAALPTRQAANADGSQSHTVQAGDTLSGIAIIYDTNVDAILALNNLTRADTRRIRVGQVLVISE